MVLYILYVYNSHARLNLIRKRFAKKIHPAIWSLKVINDGMKVGQLSFCIAHLCSH